MSKYHETFMQIASLRKHFFSLPNTREEAKTFFLSLWFFISLRTISCILHEWLPRWDECFVFVQISLRMRLWKHDDGVGVALPIVCEKVSNWIFLISSGSECNCKLEFDDISILENILVIEWDGSAFKQEVISKEINISQPFRISNWYDRLGAPPLTWQRFLRLHRRTNLLCHFSEKQFHLTRHEPEWASIAVAASFSVCRHAHHVETTSMLAISDRWLFIAGRWNSSRNSFPNRLILSLPLAPTNGLFAWLNYDHVRRRTARPARQKKSLRLLISFHLDSPSPSGGNAEHERHFTASYELISARNSFSIPLKAHETK